MFEVLSTVLKYIFITIIYLFIFSIVRLIYLDVRAMGLTGKFRGDGMPYLKLVNLRDNLDFKVEESYVISGDEALIGRRAKNGISIQDPFLSKKHAKIIKKNGTYLIEDLESTNGTRLNGIRVEPGKEPVSLKNGDRLQLGQLDFLFVEENDGEKDEEEKRRMRP